jgi:hypothetical protein
MLTLHVRNKPMSPKQEHTDKPETGSDPIATAKPEPSAAAKRALAEAEVRRKARDAARKAPEKEIGGRGGADPARYGDWEIDGRAIDF